jgi:acetolactate synthase-1/2/3 large subunit
MKGSEALIRSLMKAGVKHMFGILGGQIMEVYDVLYDIDKKELRHILMRHEQCAAHAAEGYAKASGKVGVCIATSGPGATNLVTGIADAHADSTPMVALTGQVPLHAIGNDAFQEADIVGITMPITKHNFQITDPDKIASSVKAAFEIASSRRQGPVLIDFPRDMQQKQLEKKFEYPKEVTLPGYKVSVSGGHPNQIKEAASLLVSAQQPVIISGGGVISSNASRELVSLAESLNIPVATTLMGKGGFPEDHPLSLGLVGMHGRKTANLMVSDSDVLFAIGCRFSDRITGNVKHFATKAKVIHADVDSAEIGKNVRVDVPIVGDAKLVLQGLNHVIGKIKSKKDGPWQQKLRQFKKEYAPFYDYDDKLIKPQRVMKELNSILDNKTIITTEVGQCQMWSAHYLNIRHARNFITSGGLGTMGAGFPMAIGAKMARPDCKVIDVGSEGSFLMTGQDMATCVVEDIPVTVVLLDNRYLGMVKQWQDLFYNKRYSHTYLGESPDFVKYADAFGAGGILVERPSEIKEALVKAVKSNKPYIVDIRVDPHETTLPMVPPQGKIHEMIEKK